MEEIKFRQPIIKDGVFEGWHYWGYLIQGNLGAFTTPLSSNFGEIQPSYQFTGMKDKNGVEVYAGDILRYTKVIDSVRVKNQKTGIYFHRKRKNPKTEYHYWEVFFSKHGSWKKRRDDTETRLYEGLEKHEVVGSIYNRPVQ